MILKTLVALAQDKTATVFVRSKHLISKCKPYREVKSNSFVQLKN